MNKLPFTAAAVTLALSPAAYAQLGAAQVASAHAAVRPGSVPRGGKGTLTVTLTVSPKYHVNAAKPNDPNYIATSFTPQPAPGVTFGPVRYPAPKPMALSYSPKPLLVYTGAVVVTVPFTVSRAAKPGPLPLSGTVNYQGCDAKSCFPPASAPVKATLTVK